MLIVFITKVPVNVASAMKHELGAMRALTLLGNIALSRYSLLKPR